MAEQKTTYTKEEFQSFMERLVELEAKDSKVSGAGKNNEIIELESIISTCEIVNQEENSVSGSSKRTKYTKDGFRKLIEELYYLKVERRAEIKVMLKEARAFGDLSENSEYDEARDQQAKCEARIAELEYLIKNGVIMSEEEANKNIVSIGSTVTLKYKDGREVTYYLVGSNEVDPLNKKISDLSPIGMAVIGKTKGDNVVISAPSGDKDATITHFERTKK